MMRASRKQDRRGFRNVTRSVHTRPSDYAGSVTSSSTTQNARTTEEAVVKESRPRATRTVSCMRKGYACVATWPNERTRSKRRAIPIVHTSPMVYVSRAVARLDTTWTLSERVNYPVSRGGAIESACVANSSRRTAESAPARNAPKRIRHFSPWSTSAGVAVSTGNRSVATLTPICAGADIRKTDIRCFAGIAMRQADSPEYVHTCSKNGGKHVFIQPRTYLIEWAEALAGQITGWNLESEPGQMAPIGAAALRALEPAIAKSIVAGWFRAAWGADLPLVSPPASADGPVSPDTDDAAPSTLGLASLSARPPSEEP